MFKYIASDDHINITTINNKLNHESCLYNIVFLSSTTHISGIMKYDVKNNMQNNKIEIRKPVYIS